jgi:hypothetical protein
MRDIPGASNASIKARCEIDLSPPTRTAPRSAPTLKIKGLGATPAFKTRLSSSRQNILVQLRTSLRLFEIPYGARPADLARGKPGRSFADRGWTSGSRRAKKLMEMVSRGWFA